MKSPASLTTASSCVLLPTRFRVKDAARDARQAGDEGAIHRAWDVLADWRKLTTSDHFYYMCTKYFEDGDVHKYFNPYDSPYDSYINFMNVLDNVRSRAAIT